MQSSIVKGVVVAAILLLACQKDSSTSSPEKGGSSSSSGTPTSEPRSNEVVNVSAETLDVDNTIRHYTLAVPKARDASKALPLILELHGDGGDGPSMRDAYQIDAVSGAAAVVAYPSGRNGGWELYEPSATNADNKFIDALVTRLVAQQNIDPKRVFGVGFSSGGYLINQLSCRKNGFFRGIVAHGAGAPQEPQDPSASQWKPEFVKCNGQQMAPAGGVATLSVMGQGDDPEGGRFDATYWAFVNGCGESATPVTAPCEAFQGCPADKPVQLCIVPGLGHAVWDKGLQESWAFIKALL